MNAGDSKLLVLTVDDSPAILEAVSAVLSNEYQVFKLPKPTMLEDVLKQVNPSLFLLDYQMPERNGFELIPIIRSLEAHKHTPIIFLTSEGTMDHIKTAIGLGACDFIVKPFNPEQLREKVAKHISKK
jgi:PleD family two-component response regulator